MKIKDLFIPVPVYATKRPEIYRGGTFTDNHHLGLMSEQPVDYEIDARNYFVNFAYDRTIYVKNQSGHFVISRERLYSPVVRNFVSLQITPERKIYRWNQVTHEGVLLRSVVIHMDYLTLNNDGL